jgi:hypothetical protein
MIAMNDKDGRLREDYRPDKPQPALRPENISRARVRTAGANLPRDTGRWFRYESYCKIPNLGPDALYNGGFGLGI